MNKPLDKACEHPTTDSPSDRAVRVEIRTQTVTVAVNLVKSKGMLNNA